MQSFFTILLVVWASWLTLGFLLPKQRRQIQGRIARLLEGHVPQRLVEWVRPGFPKTGCGCGTQCHDDESKF